MHPYLCLEVLSTMSVKSVSEPFVPDGQTNARLGAIAHDGHPSAPEQIPDSRALFTVPRATTVGRPCEVSLLQLWTYGQVGTPTQVLRLP